MPRDPDPAIRIADLRDRALVEGLLARSEWRHAHLDWLDPIDLLDRAPFLLASLGDRPTACLACPPDPPAVAWIRVFAGTADLPAPRAWHALWPTACESARQTGAETAAVLTADRWMASLLLESGFIESNRVVFLEHRGAVDAPRLPPGVRLRAFHPADLPAVCDVDRRAFEGLWEYSQPVLSAALQQAASVTILEAQGAVCGYQLSTASALGAHLARLAVLPEQQGRGYGRALVEHMLHEFVRQGLDRVSVNTQEDNRPSLRLYRRLGFRETRQSFPVFTRLLRRSRGDGR